MGAFVPRLLTGFFAISLVAQTAAAVPIDVTYNVTATLSSVQGCSACASGTQLAGTITLRLPGGAATVGGAIDLDGIVTLISGELATTDEPLRLWIGPDFNDTTDVTEITLPTATGFGGFSPLNLTGSGIFIEGSVSPGSFLFADVLLQFGFTPDDATGHITGTEVSRSLVPEPGIPALLGGTLALRAIRRRVA